MLRDHRFFKLKNVRFLSIYDAIISATWSQWSECLGSCMSSRRRVCSEQYGCNGLEYEEVECPKTDDLCFQGVSDKLPKGLFVVFIMANLIHLMFGGYNDLIVVIVGRF